MLSTYFFRKSILLFFLLISQFVFGRVYYSQNNGKWNSVKWSGSGVSAKSIYQLSLNSSDKLIVRHAISGSGVYLNRGSIVVVGNGSISLSGDLTVDDLVITDAGKVDAKNVTIKRTYLRNTSSATNALKVRNSLRVALINNNTTRFTGTNLIFGSLEVTGDYSTFYFPGGTFIIKKQLMGKWGKTKTIDNSATVLIGANAGGSNAFNNLERFKFINRASGSVTVQNSRAFDKGNTMNIENYGYMNLPRLEMDNRYGQFTNTGEVIIRNRVEIKDIAFNNSGTFTTKGPTVFEGSTKLTNNGSIVSTYVSSSSGKDFELKADGLQNNGSIEIAGNVMIHQNGVLKNNGDIHVSGNMDFASNNKKSILYEDSQMSVDGYICVWKGYHQLNINRGATAIAETVPARSSHGASCQDISGSLPVEFAFVMVDRHQNTIQVEWGTASETNNDYFIVEYSANGIDFTPVSKVEGQGTYSGETEYMVVLDESEEYRFFRIKQVDFDGKYSYSYIVENNLQTDKHFQFSHYPSKVYEEFTITAHEMDISVFIYTVDGKIVDHKRIKANSPIQHSFNTAGYYILSINNRNITRLIITE